MRFKLFATLAVLMVLMSAASASAGEPPNQNDPCSTAGRDSCGTTGKGFYKTYKFGLRWFGDYRGAVPNVTGSTFCIDLRYWYPSADYKYKSRNAAGLHNRDGGKISRQDLSRMSYALWNYGRSNSDKQQAAAMLYVHSLMRDGAPGEITPGAAGSGPERIFRKITHNANRYAGPYKVEIKVPGNLKVGQKSKLRVRVVSSSGHAVPNAKLRLDSSGTSGLDSQVSTGNSGVAEVSFTPNNTKLKVSADTIDLASALPKLFVPTTKKAARNGQRLVAPDSGKYDKKISAHAKRTQAKVKTKATPGELATGDKAFDSIKISGVPSDFKHEIKVRLYGPYPSRDGIDCAGSPAFDDTVNARSGTTKSPKNSIGQPGFYTYRVVVPSTNAVKGVTTKCGEAGETLKGLAVPKVSTQVSDAIAEPGVSLTDDVLVSNLQGQTAKVTANLYGPFSSPSAVKCDGKPFATSTFTANGDGTYTTDPVQLDTAGYYTYREAIEGQFVRPGSTKCGESTETTIVRGNPEIETKVNSKSTHPGSKLSDKVKITGLGKLSAPVKVDLWGPYETKNQIDCTAPRAARQTFTARGDGTYKTKPVKLQKAGYYTYREAIEATDSHSGANTQCAEGPETTITTATPKIKTVVNSDVVKPGSKLRDKLKVKGLGKTSAKVKVELFGPFSKRAAIGCSTSKRVAKQELSISGDGTHLTEPVRVNKVGFYSYREAIRSTNTTKGVKTKCAEVPETSLARPLIVTGRGDPNHQVLAKASGSNRPKRIKIDRLNIDAPTLSVGIALREGILGVPANIDKTGWWVDGSRPGEKGATLIAGHVDSAKRGAGAFFRLTDARKGDKISVDVSGGGTKHYRVTSVDERPKPKLPTDVFSRNGRERLVIVTCGGPFDQQKGHYRDNIIVTAVPTN